MPEPICMSTAFTAGGPLLSVVVSTDPPPTDEEIDELPGRIRAALASNRRSRQIKRVLDAAEAGRSSGELSEGDALELVCDAMRVEANAA